MNLRILLAVGAALPLGALAANEFTSLHPEEAHPDSTQQVSPDPYTGFIKRVQEKLHELGFHAGPVNGDFGTKTQAALAQFQLSRAVPASGQLDDQTLAELGIERDAQASAGSSPQRTVEPKPPYTEHKSERESGDKPAVDADRSEQGRELGGSCDALAGPEKDRCLQQGGTVEASAKSSSGASAPASSK